MRDTGVGIHADDVERAFARFERLPAAAGARSHEGAGIGLAMVQQLTELMGGTVTLTSEVGRGSTFTVRLPRRPTAPVPGRAAGASSTMTPRRVDDFLREVQTWQQPTGPASAPGRPCAAARSPARVAPASSWRRTTPTCARTSATSSVTPTTSSSWRDGPGGPRRRSAARRPTSCSAT